MPLNKRIYVKPCTGAWFVLVALSTATYVAGYSKTGTLFITFILIITLLKGQLIIRYYMGIRRVRLLWHFIIGAYLVVIGAIIGLAYLSH